MDFSNLIRPPKLLNLALEAHQAKKEAKRLRDRTRDFLGNNEEMVGDEFIDSLPPSPQVSPTPPLFPGGEDSLNMELLLKRVQALETQKGEGSNRGRALRPSTIIQAVLATSYQSSRTEMNFQLLKENILMTHFIHLSTLLDTRIALIRQ